ncbi:MAG: ornithine carbamoyltransferase [Anaerolineae bacterium]|jgi:N-acetylornithine carbamoyltransferase|nr:ornithine carbamoyltransferase [Anaerolineae bacterium]MBT3712359.1 ornithine carbamoyltransferase [Anaerolineae bacterium]MBT4309666.1 ornithine carbamoyltransferase [Anaerolineae bacterium]MBT4459440.1 ornithine carbamoyltransferase [Anaerolineae bacterium]MBT4842040.1 ornithine carbamoyltransferase [Anaerolineae bacterium]
MQSDLRGRDLIGDLDFTKEEVETILDVAWDLKKKRALGESHAYLRDKTLAMLFFFSSTRTRGSFESGMAQLGGHAAFIESRTTQISHGDTETEMGEIFGRYFDGIAIRHVDWGIGNRYLNLVASASRVPVLNMQCEIYHPHQCLADIMTIIEKKGRNLKRKKMVVSWAYASSYLKPISVPQSLILQMPRFGLDVVLAHPPEFKLMPEIMEQAKEQARLAGAGFEVTDDMEAAFKDADIVYAKSWGPLLTTQDPDEGKAIQDKYSHWITDQRKMDLAKPDAIYMHPLPADRDVEVTSEVMDGPNSVVFDQAENRMHAQKAVMALTMR